MRRWTILFAAVIVAVGVGLFWLGGPRSDPPTQVEPVKGRWRYIVLHHSATAEGNAERFGRHHRRRGWDELGYHFVIDNGLGGPDGRVEVGPRWRKQKTGAHTGGTPNDEYNRRGIGICLVGDFRAHGPTAAQLAALETLLRELMAAHEIPASHVIGHCQAPNTETKCPGRVFLDYLNTTLRPALERGASSRPSTATTVSGNR